MPLQNTLRRVPPSQRPSRIHDLDLARHLDAAWMMESVGLSPEPWQRELLQCNNRLVALLCPRQSGKSTATAAVALHRAMYHRGSIVLVVSRTQRQSDLLFGTTSGIFDRLTDVRLTANKRGNALEFSNGSKIVSLPGDEATIRGYTADLVVIDEAARVADAVFTAIYPMIMRRNGRIIALSTPAGQRGFFYRACTDPSGPWKVIKGPSGDYRCKVTGFGLMV
jgi:phage terminase large subunit-like protein